MPDDTKKRLRGFAALPPERRAAISSAGGKRAHELGTAHTWKKGEEARAAGARGGTASRERRRP